MTYQIGWLVTAGALLFAACGGAGGDTETTLNSTPVADAGADVVTDLGSTVALDGSRSSDADGDPLIYRWSFVGSPLQSSAATADERSATLEFTPDLPGSYLLALVVDDGTIASVPDIVQVTAVVSPLMPHPDALDALLVSDFDRTMDSLGEQNPFVRDGYLLSDDGLSSVSGLHGLHCIEAALVPLSVNRHITRPHLESWSAAKIAPPPHLLSACGEPAGRRAAEKRCGVVETIQKIRVAAHRDQKSTREIVKELRFSRNTVRHALRSGATAFQYQRGVQLLPFGILVTGETA